MSRLERISFAKRLASLFGALDACRMNPLVEAG